ncbi:hypothetical protein [Chryseosolibacter indicus]|uniref:Uncharacterized protein n=1 Tax=Chryseosolibacter indicus TaxID=2782351 RepID=A0ABS5VPK4_9BACT|nr:hypothetical protein [Chryseosolibacter indicus]MBT1702953.1 hypothetical protein [Chryseosolibacter indicus]
MIKFFKRYNELWLGPLGLVLFIFSNPLIKAIDPEAVVYTTDAVQKIIFGHVAFAACVFSTWLCLKLTWPSAFKYLTKDFDRDFSQLNNNEKCVKLYLAFSLLALYLLGLIACMHVL